MVDIPVRVGYRVSTIFGWCGIYATHSNNICLLVAVSVSGILWLFANFADYRWSDSHMFDAPPFLSLSGIEDIQGESPQLCD